MNCPNCGTRVGATDTYCSYCGARVYHHQEDSHPPKAPAPDWSPLRDTGNSKNDEDSSKKNLRALVVSIVSILAAIALAAGIFTYINHRNEESLWEECVSRKRIDDLRTYIEKYPDGEHYNEAKKMFDDLVRDKEDWDQARVSNDEDHLRSYIRNHPGSEHLDEARKILDDLVWNKAVTANGKDAYEQYVKEFPDGRHIADAREHLDEKRRAELTDSERDNVRSTVHNFLLALEEWDVNLMLSTCNTQLSSFMGKPQASLDDVKEYFDAYRESDIDSIGFSELNIDVKKVIRDDKRAEYKVVFTTTRRMRREDADEELVASMKGQALLDDRYRFNELTMDKVTQ